MPARGHQHCRCVLVGCLASFSAVSRRYVVGPCRVWFKLDRSRKWKFGEVRIDSLLFRCMHVFICAHSALWQLEWPRGRRVSRAASSRRKRRKCNLPGESAFGVTTTYRTYMFNSVYSRVIRLGKAEPIAKVLTEAHPGAVESMVES